MARGIHAVLQLATSAQLPGLVSMKLGIHDAEPLSGQTIREAVDFVSEQKACGHSTLVCCSGGFSRSVAIAAAALHEEERISLRDALEVIRSVHPDAQPHPHLWESLCVFYQEPAAAGASHGRADRRSRR